MNLEQQLDKNFDFIRVKSKQSGLKLKQELKDNINYFVLFTDELEVGYYYQDVSDGDWYWRSYIEDMAGCCYSKEAAFAIVQAIWMGWCR